MSVLHKITKCLTSPKTGIFAAGVLFGTAGIKILSSRDAKTCYSHATAAVIRAKDSVVKTATTIQENCEDIYEEAKAINEERELEEAWMEEFEADDEDEEEEDDDDKDEEETEKEE